MGKHSVVRGEKSTAGGSNGSPRRDEQHTGKHRTEAGSDLPPRGENVQDVDTRRR